MIVPFLGTKYNYDPNPYSAAEDRESYRAHLFCTVYKIANKRRLRSVLGKVSIHLGIAGNGQIFKMLIHAHFVGFG